MNIKGKEPNIYFIFPMKISANQIVDSFLRIDVFQLMNEEEIVGLEHHFITPNELLTHLGYDHQWPIPSQRNTIKHFVFFDRSSQHHF